MLEKIICIAKHIYTGDEIEWGEDTSIVMDMELSSMEFFSFISEVEGQLNIRISERELKRIDTLGELAEIAEKKVEK